MSDLLSIRCVGCEGGIPPLSEKEMFSYLNQTEGWSLSADKKSISRHYTFKGFNKTMGFVNAVAWIANQENHHPDMKIGFNYCTITLTTHAISGLTKNDFICAAKINRLEASE